MRWSSRHRSKAIGAIVIIAGLLALSTACGVRIEDEGALTVSTATARQSPTASVDVTKPAAQPIPTANRQTTSTPQPTVSVENLNPSTSLAYFHSLSSNGEPPELLASEVDFIVLTDGDGAYRDALRSAGYDGLILQYLNASQINGPGPYTDVSATCDTTFKPQRNGILRKAGDFCNRAHPNEDWFLHNGAGERLYSIIGESNVWYHMNPGNSAWQAFASQEIARDVVGPRARGFDGLLLDNVELSLTRLQTQAQNADGVVREYERDDDYRAAWSEYLGQIRFRVGDDVPLWADLVSDPNTGATWASYVSHLDGVMSPAFATGYEPLTVSEWQNNLSQAESAVSAGKGLVAVGNGRRDDEALQQFALASYLLVSDGSDAYFRYMSNESNESVVSLWLYPNYEIKLGAALGPRAKSGTSWRRDFQCGYVEVNPTERTGTIVQTACHNGTVP